MTVCFHGNRVKQSVFLSSFAPLICKTWTSQGTFMRSWSQTYKSVKWGRPSLSCLLPKGGKINIICIECSIVYEMPLAIHWARKQLFPFAQRDTKAQRGWETNPHSHSWQGACGELGPLLLALGLVLQPLHQKLPAEATESLLPGHMWAGQSLPSNQTSSGCYVQCMFL